MRHRCFLFLLFIGYGCSPNPRPNPTTTIVLNTVTNNPESSEKTIADQSSRLAPSILVPSLPPRFTLQGPEVSIWLVIDEACTELTFRSKDSAYETGRVWIGRPEFRYTLKSDILIFEHPSITIEQGIATKRCRMELENGPGPTLGGSPVFDSDEECQVMRTSVPSVSPSLVSQSPSCDKTIEPSCVRQQSWQRHSYGDCFKDAFYPWDDFLHESPPRRIVAFFKEGRQFYWRTSRERSDHCQQWTIHPASDDPRHGQLKTSFVVDGVTELHQTNYELHSKQIHLLGTSIDRHHPDGHIEQIRRNSWGVFYFVLEGKVRNPLSGPWYRSEEQCRDPFLFPLLAPKKEE